MKKIIALCALLTMLLCACGEPTVYTPAGSAAGLDSLDAQTLAILQEVCKPELSETQNLQAVYTWVADSLTYRASAAASPDVFTDEVIASLADTALSKRKTDCDGEAAVMAALLRRMGYDAQVVRGAFVREAGQDPVDHAWVAAHVGGELVHFDPLYGKHYAADNALAYCMASAEALSASHSWDAAKLQ